MNITFHGDAWVHYQEWQGYDRKLLRKLNALIRECSRTPYSGLGKPEPLTGDYSGWWSRRIDQEHRLIYKVEADGLHILQCRYHYND